MKRILEIIYEGKESSFSITKISRSKLYGSIRRIPVDREGRECVRASLTRDGSHILPKGGTASLYLDELGDVVERSQLRILDLNGEMTGETSHNAVLENAQAVEAKDILEYTNTHAYALEPIFLSQELDSLLSQGNILHLPLTDGNSRHSFLIGNHIGYFLLIGEPNGFDFIGPEEADLSPPDIEGRDHDFEDNLDFGMI
jgi:hypothetical protein